MKKKYQVLLSIILFLFITSISFGQMEDDLLFEDEEDQGVVVCVPDCLITNYDQFKDAEVSLMDIRQWYSFGSEYFKNKAYKSALPYLWKVFLNDSTKYARNSIRKIADSYFNLQMADSTLIASYRGLALFPDQIRLHYWAGRIQEKIGKFTCAIPHYEALVESDKENPQYLEKLAFLYFKNEDLKALEVQKKLVTLDPANSKYSEMLATMTRVLLGDGPELLKALREAHEKDPNNISSAYQYGKTANEQGEYQQALEPLSNIIEKLDSKHVGAYKTRAQCYESLEKYSSAINDYKKLIELEPTNAEIMCDIANVYRIQEQFSKGKYWVNKALSAKAGYGKAYITMGEIYESAVDKCQQNRGRKYDDGLVYHKAYSEYYRAMKDPVFKNMAKNRQKNLVPYLLTKEEKFMNQDRKTLKNPCYTSWIK